MGLADSSRRIRIADIELAYRITGRGKPVILVDKPQDYSNPGINSEFGLKALKALCLQRCTPLPRVSANFLAFPLACVHIVCTESLCSRLCVHGAHSAF